MIKHFVILDHQGPRPEADKIIFCDGTGGSNYQPETDLELSHWRPNHTPAEYRAGTSTEIGYRFLEHPRPGDFTVAVNNHVDVDGILSVYVLVESRHALAHRQTIVQAAEMGDFWGWGEPAAQRLFQGLTWLKDRGGTPQEIYDEAFRRIPGLIDGSDPESEAIDVSLAPLREGVTLLERGTIIRRVWSERFVQYEIPFELDVVPRKRAWYIPEFNEAISDQALLWPHVRNRLDAQRVCLVSVGNVNSWIHDVWFPGYLWADTEGLWQPPGFEYQDGMSRYEYRNKRLDAALRELQETDSEEGIWDCGGSNGPLDEELQKVFPVVVRYMESHGRHQPSQLSPEIVARHLATAFE